MPIFSPVDIRGFTGINLREPPNRIEDTETVICENFNLGRSGELVKRQGAERIHFGETLGNNSVQLLGHFKTSSVSYLVAVAGGVVYYSPDGETWTALVTANVKWGVQYTNKYYMLRTDGFIIEWDPSSTTELLLPEERDFEQDTLEGWSIEQNITSLVTSEEQARTGSFSMKAVATNTSAAHVISRKITASPGYQITFSYYIFASFAKTARITVRWYNSSDTIIDSTTTTASTVNGSWTLLTIASGIAPANTTYARLLIALDNPAASDAFYIDDASAKIGAGIPRHIDGSPSGTAAIVFKDRLFVVNSEGTGNVNSRLYFSEIGDFADWPSVNFIDIQPGEGDFLTAISIIQDLLVVFKTESIRNLFVQGAPENWAVRIMSPEIGCVSKFTPGEFEGFLYFVGRNSVYRTDGNVFEDVAEPLHPLFADRTINLTSANKDSASWWDDKYVLQLHPVTGGPRYFILHSRRGGWTEWTFPGTTAPSSFLEVTTEAPSKGLYAGDFDNTGKIFRFGEDVYLDEGVSFDCKVKTKDYDFEAIANMKRILWAVLEHEGDGNITVNHFANQVLRNTGAVTGQAGKVATKVIGPGFLRSYQLEIVHAASNAFIFYGAVLMIIPKRTLTKSGV